MHHSRRWRTLAVLTSISLLALGACGDDDDETAAEATTTTAPDDAGTADVAGFCDAWIRGEQLFNEGPEVDPASGEPTPEGIQAFVAEVQPVIADISANTPSEIETEVGLVLDAVRQALAGDQSAFESEEVGTADQAVDDFLFTSCEFDDTAEIVAVDYDYEGVPEEIAAGRVALRMDNQGEEIHEAVVLRINDDSDLTVEEILELPEEEAMEQAEVVGNAFGPPGEQTSDVLELEAGSYAFICFLPVGATSFEALESGELEGADTHWARGMLAEFTVS